MDSLLDDIESRNCGSEAELGKTTNTQQNRNPDFAGYQNPGEKECMDSKKLEEAIYEPTIYKHSEDENLKTFQYDLKVSESIAKGKCF